MDMQVNKTYKPINKTLKSQLSKESVNPRNRPIEYCLILFLLIFCFANIILSVMLLPFSITLYLVLFCVQGIVLHHLGQMVHECYVHGKNMPYSIAFVIAALTNLSVTKYKRSHILHHTHIPQTPNDPDKVWNSPNSFFQRMLSFTFIYHFICLLKEKHNLTRQQIKFSQQEKQRIKAESLAFILLAILSIIGLFIGIPLLFYGWLMPLLLIGPLITGFRIFSEHGIRDINTSKNNPPATSLLTPRWMQYTPFVICYGTGHMMHHLYPLIPWYRYHYLLPTFENEMARLYPMIKLRVSLLQWIKQGLYLSQGSLKMVDQVNVDKNQRGL